MTSLRIDRDVSDQRASPGNGAHLDNGSRNHHHRSACCQHAATPRSQQHTKGKSEGEEGGELTESTRISRWKQSRGERQWRLHIPLVDALLARGMSSSEEDIVVNSGGSGGEACESPAAEGVVVDEAVLGVGGRGGRGARVLRCRSRRRIRGFENAGRTWLLGGSRRRRAVGRTNVQSNDATPTTREPPMLAQMVAEGKGLKQPRLQLQRAGERAAGVWVRVWGRDIHESIFSRNASRSRWATARQVRSTVVGRRGKRRTQNEREEDKRGRERRRRGRDREGWKDRGRGRRGRRRQKGSARKDVRRLPLEQIFPLQDPALAHAACAATPPGQLAWRFAVDIVDRKPSWRDRTARNSAAALQAAWSPPADGGVRTHGRERGGQSGENPFATLPRGALPRSP